MAPGNPEQGTSRALWDVCSGACPYARTFGIIPWLSWPLQGLFCPKYKEKERQAALFHKDFDQYLPMGDRKIGGNRGTPLFISIILSETVYFCNSLFDKGCFLYSWRYFLFYSFSSCQISINIYIFFQSLACFAQAYYHKTWRQAFATQSIFRSRYEPFLHPIWPGGQ